MREGAGFSEDEQLMAEVFASHVSLAVSYAQALDSASASAPAPQAEHTRPPSEALQHGLLRPSLTAPAPAPPPERPSVYREESTMDSNISDIRRQVREPQQGRPSLAG